MILKILGIVCVIVGSSLVPITIINRIKTACRNIEDIYNGIKMVESEVLYLGNKLSLCFENASKRISGDTGLLFGEISTSLDTNKSLSGGDVFLQIVKKREKILYLNDGVVSALTVFCGVFGCSDENGISECMDAVKRMLLDEIDKSKENLLKKEKLYMSLGVLVGFMFAIILL